MSDSSDWAARAARWRDASSKRGYDLTLWARRPATPRTVRRHRREDRRSRPPSSAAASDLVCVCVVGDDDVREVLGGDTGVFAGLAPGGIVAIHSTVHPDTCREIAEYRCRPGCFGDRCAGQRRRRPRPQEGKLLVMVGGDDDVVERCRPVFATYGDPIVHLGPLGSGQVAKILNNVLFTANLGTAMSTLELGESLGISRDRLCDVITRGSANSMALGSMAGDGGTLEVLRPGRGSTAAEGRSACREPRRCRVGAAGCGVRRRRRRAGRDGASAVTRVGFVGAGRMGAPMVRRLVEAGHDVRVLGRTPEKCRAVKELGAQRGHDSSPRSPTTPTSSSCACSPTSRCGRCAWRATSSAR